MLPLPTRIEGATALMRSGVCRLVRVNAKVAVQHSEAVLRVADSVVQMVPVKLTVITVIATVILVPTARFDVVTASRA